MCTLTVYANTNVYIDFVHKCKCVHRLCTQIQVCAYRLCVHLQMCTATLYTNTNVYIDVFTQLQMCILTLYTNTTAGVLPLHINTNVYSDVVHKCKCVHRLCTPIFTREFVGFVYTCECAQRDVFTNPNVYVDVLTQISKCTSTLYTNTRKFVGFVYTCKCVQ